MLFNKSFLDTLTYSIEKITIYKNTLKHKQFELKKYIKNLIENSKNFENEDNSNSNKYREEYSSYKNILKIYNESEIILDKINIELITLKEILVILTNLQSSLAIIKEINKKIFKSMDDINNFFNDFNSIIDETLKIRMKSNTCYAGKKSTEVEEILEEAIEFIEKNSFSKTYYSSIFNTNENIKS